MQSLCAPLLAQTKRALLSHYSYATLTFHTRVRSSRTRVCAQVRVRVQGGGGRGTCKWVVVVALLCLDFVLCQETLSC